MAVASTAGAVGASIGLHVDALGGPLASRLEQKVASELTETLADRALSTAAPTLKRMSSKRRRELARLSTDPTSVETSGHQCTGPCMDCLDATWERPPVVRRTRSNELRVRGVV